MGVDELVERSTVKFDRALDSNGVRGLFRYLAKEVPYNITYVVENHESLVHPWHANRVVVNEHGSFKFSGMFNILGGTSSAGFSCGSFVSPSLRADSLAFSTILGYELSEHRAEEVAVWDNVRVGIEKYFKEKKNVLE